MSNQESQKDFYTPSEAAKKLGISITMLRYLRNTGRIEGTSLGNTTVYTQAQIEAADLTSRKPGPKTDKQKKQNGQNEEPLIGDAYGTFREKHVLVGLAS